MKTSQIIFKYAYPLDRGRRALFKERAFGEYPTVLVVKKEVERIKKIWSKINKEDRLIKRLTQLTGISLNHDLEMYLFGTGLNPMSKPLMMPVVREGGKKFTDYEIVEIIIHELCHRFAGDQEEYIPLNKYWTMVHRKYKNESELTQSHIIVYALLDIVLGELFPKKMEYFMKPTDKNYVRAVEIVKNIGSQEILAEFKKSMKV